MGTSEAVGTSLLAPNPPMDPHQPAPPGYNRQRSTKSVAPEPAGQLVFIRQPGWAAPHDLVGPAKADHNRQMAADAEELLQVGLTGYGGPRWRKLEARLITYARKTLPRKIVTGEIFAMMNAKGVGAAADLALPKGRPVTIEEARDLADEVIARSIGPFKELLKAGHWNPDPDVAAVLTSYFVGSCCLRFRTPWRRYLRERRRDLRSDLAIEAFKHDGFEEETGPSTNPPAVVLARVEADHYRARITDPRDLAIIELVAHGYTQAEIAEHLDTTEKSVEYRVHKVRQSALRHRSEISSRNLRGNRTHVA